LNVATGFRRLGLALLAAVAVGGALVTASEFLISPDSVRKQALAEIRDAAGLDPVLRGPTTVRLLPYGSVSFADVALGEGPRPPLTAERLTVRLRFLPLLLGRVEISELALERPTITIDLEPDGRSNWAGLIAGLRRSQSAEGAHAATFSEMRIEDGTVVLNDSRHRVSERLSDVDFSLAWPAISKSFGATGHFAWHGRPLDASLTLSDFPAALSGDRTGLKVRLSGSLMKAAFEGAVAMKPTLKIEGTLAADSPSLRDALVWSGQKPLPGGGFGRFAIKSQANVVGDTIALTGVNVDLDGNTAEGVLAFATSGRQTVQGTLAADTLDLTPYISTVRLLTANQHEWNSNRIGLDGLSGMDLDLRVSAAKVILSNAKLGRTAIGANLRGGKLVVTVGEAQAYGGVIKGSVTLADRAHGIDLQSQLNFENVNLDTCLEQLAGVRRLEGKGNMTLIAEGHGDSVLAVTQTLNGTATLLGQNGALNGINVEQLLRRLERRPLSGGGEFRTGRTPYDKIKVNLKIVNGTVAVDEMKIEGPAVKLAMAGSASIPMRELDLTGTAALIATARDRGEPFSLPFVVQGSWDDPIMLPDAEALIRRSGAAAPLLDAIREQHARDKVRSVIERLTGAPTADALPAGGQPDGK
jgi:AsmA protein